MKSKSEKKRIKVMSKKTLPKKIVQHMTEPRPIPMGMTEFDEWSSRIISGALVPGATEESQRFTLASMILHLGPTESHKPDAHFIHGLRCAANKQVAYEVLRQIDEAKKKRVEEEVAKQRAEDTEFLKEDDEDEIL